MIRSIHLKNFRKHSDALIDFTAGLNVIRGPNEAGKTTITEALLYALYGSKALRNPLAETVTWGEKENSLTVKLVLSVNGIDYVFTRGKAGAECNYEGGKVTGQAEVTAFAGNLLGADARVASLLMLASQNGLRGALDDGPAAVSALMGKLADFDLIDRLLENASQKLALGSAVPTQTKLAEADLEVVAAQVALAAEDPVPALDAQIAGLQLQITGIESNSGEVLQPAMGAADAALQQALATATAKVRADAAVVDYAGQIVRERGNYAAALLAAGRRPDALKIEALRTQLHDAAAHQVVLDAHASFQKLPGYPAEFWEGTRETLDADIATEKAKRADIEKRSNEVSGEIRTLMSTLITSGKCPTCGHAARSDEHVAEHNASINAKLCSVRLRLASVQAEMKPAFDVCQAMEAVIKSGQPFDRLAIQLGDRLTVDASFYPPKLTWNGAVPQPNGNRAAIRIELQQLEAADRAAAQAQGQATAHLASVGQLERYHASAVFIADAIVVPEATALSEAYDAAYAAYAKASADARELKNQAQALNLVRDDAICVRKEAGQRLVVAQERVVEYTKDIKTIEFNNALVGKLKKLKPMITDFLWNTVLAAVGNFFSTLRGEQSVVTKDAGGFKVNAKSIESLSGSTLDCLALAIRVALSKTFIPQASFLVLDEPAHGCDNERTSNVLGFLSTVGFQQTVLASHDELSEAVADNVIVIGS